MTALLLVGFGAVAGGAFVFYNYLRVYALVPKRFGGGK